jgi:hypothetical protein
MGERVRVRGKSISFPFLSMHTLPNLWTPVLGLITSYGSKEVLLYSKRIFGGKFAYVNKITGRNA